MIVIPDNCIFIDVDDTLILSGEGLFIPREPNEPLIAKIKEWYEMGRTVIVWTSNGNGVKHCIRTVGELGLEDYVHMVMPKPSTIVDDDHLEYYNIIDPITLRVK